MYSLDFASQRSFEKPQQEQPPNLIARKRSAQAEGGGVKERSSRTPTIPLRGFGRRTATGRPLDLDQESRCLIHRPNALRLLGVTQHIARFAVTALGATLS